MRSERVNKRKAESSDTFRFLRGRMVCFCHSERSEESSLGEYRHVWCVLLKIRSLSHRMTEKLFRDPSYFEYFINFQIYVEISKII